MKYNTGFIYAVCAVSAMGGLLFGYDWVVIGGAVKFYEEFFGITGDTISCGWATSSALVGCMFGAMTAGAMADRYGRKPLLVLAAVFFTISAITTGLFDRFSLFSVARLLGGIGIGLASALSPMYIAELSPADIRGKLVSMNQMTIVLGILAAQVVNLAISSPDAGWNVEMGWRWMFWAETVPAALFLILSIFLPESPRWNALHGRAESAMKLLNRIGGLEYAKNELAAIEVPQNSEVCSVFTRRYLKVLLLGIFIAVFQQWCGTNVIFIYAQDVFAGAGYSVSDAFLNIVITGIANVIFTIVALYTVDRWGRRSLMIAGAAGLAVIYLVMGICFYYSVTGFSMVLLTVAAIACYAMTLAPVTWVLLAEMFPNAVRGKAMAIATFALWIGSCTLTFAFPSMNASMGCSGSFWIYSGVCFVGLLFFIRLLPETKGVSLEELERKFVG